MFAAGMEVQPSSPFNRYPSPEPVKAETVVMAIEEPQEDVDSHHLEDDTPIFREPNWSTAEETALGQTARPVLLQPAAREDRMKQLDKDLVARLDRGSSSSASGSPTSPESRMHLKGSEENEQEQHSDQTQKLFHDQRRSSQSSAAPPKSQQCRSHHQQRRPAPLSLNSAIPISAHQPPRLPSLTRLVPSGDQKHPQYPQASYHGHYQREHRRLSRVSKPQINSPSTYGAYTPIQVVPSWQGIPFGWPPMSMPIQIPMQAPMASPQQIISPQVQRSHAHQHQPPPSPASIATPSSASSVPAPRLREDLWKVGGQYLCNPTTADAYVRAVEIRHGSIISTSSVASVREDDMDVDAADEKSPSPAPEISINPFGNSLYLRIVIHSPGRSSIAMTREFDRLKLRDTIPDFEKSPRSPKSGTSISINTVTSSTVPISTPLSAVSSTSLARRRKSHIRAQQAGTPTTPVSAGPTRRLTMPPVPIHLPFARAHAPALAAVLLLREIHRGDSIDLPVPFPGAWLETTSYMYTGDEELLSERVKQNLWYLGGVPTSSI